MGKWTDSEIELLRNNFPQKDNAELLDLFPDRSYDSIYKKAYKLGLVRACRIETVNRKQSARKGSNNNLWHGGKTVTRKGYVMLRNPEHHRANKRGYVMEHILVWEEANSRELPVGWVVHHIDGVKNNNSPENLQAMTAGEHSVLHNSARKPAAETKRKIAIAAKTRFSCKENHPRYKNIDVSSMLLEVKRGSTVKSVCEKYGINKTTYYKKLKEKNCG